MEEDVGAIEVVIFKTKPGISQEQARKALESLNDHVKKFDGFMGRKISVDENGHWMDLVYWESKSVALKASEEIMKVPAAIQAFEVIDESTMQLFHFDPLSAFNK